jgi:hypothetical protein
MPQRIHATIRTHSDYHSVASQIPMFEQYQIERAQKIANGESIVTFTSHKKSKKKEKVAQ